jgi:hypothetical protein
MIDHQHDVEYRQQKKRELLKEVEEAANLDLKHNVEERVVCHIINGAIRGAFNPLPKTTKR